MRLWRVDYRVYNRGRWRAAGWWDTLRGAREFVRTKARLPWRIQRDLHPERHSGWPNKYMGRPPMTRLAPEGGSE